MGSGTDSTAGTGGIRRERTLATRRRMLASAYQMFCEQGYGATTMKGIAAQSGVAVQTLYFTFGTKGAILGETLGAAVVGFDSWTGPPAQADPPIDVLVGLLDWYGAFEAAPHARAALAIFVRNGAPVLRRVGPLLAAMAAGRADPDAATVLDLAERRRVATYRKVVHSLASKEPGLRAGLTQTRAADLLLVLFSAEVYYGLTAGRHWSHPRCQQFLLGVLAEQLLGTANAALA